MAVSANKYSIPDLPEMELLKYQGWTTLFIVTTCVFISAMPEALVGDEL